jgi:N-acetylmuramoyl-L-alanine amidase
MTQRTTPTIQTAAHSGKTILLPRGMSMHGNRFIVDVTVGGIRHRESFTSLDEAIRMLTYWKTNTPPRPITSQDIHKKIKRMATKHIIIHCSATTPDQNIDAEDIANWHRGRGLATIGYHYVICQNGKVQTGREKDEVGSHAKGYNLKSIGICMVGGLDTNSYPSAAYYTTAQWGALLHLVCDLKEEYPDARVCGHNQIANKACPCFNVPEWWRRSWWGLIDLRNFPHNTNRTTEL